MSFAVALFILIVFLNRYVFGWYLRVSRGRKSDDTVLDYEPTVTIVVPLFNEGRSIYRTIASFAALDYPKHKLSVTIVDDCSTDDSYEWACKGARDYPNVRVIRNAYNMGKRRGINRAVREATSAIIVSVDSDVIVHRAAVRELVSRFTSPAIAAVGGRVHISNPNENWLTRMQTVKYYFGQEHLKNLERALESVMCLSGCLTAYRRHVLLELEPILEHRSVLGVSIKYGEDRFLTHQIVTRGYKTRQTMDAMCFTKAPTTLRGYFSQQLRWKRSNIIDYLIGITDAWRLHPLVCVHYTSMLLLLFVYPFVIVANVLQHEFLELAFLHVQVIALFGMLYWLSPGVRRLPPWLRVHPIAFLPMAVMMPVAYLILTPLGVFTLDSSSWETRGHQATTPNRVGRFALGSDKVAAIDREIAYVQLPAMTPATDSVAVAAASQLALERHHQEAVAVGLDHGGAIASAPGGGALTRSPVPSPPVDAISPSRDPKPHTDRVGRRTRTFGVALLAASLIGLVGGIAVMIVWAM